MRLCSTARIYPWTRSSRRWNARSAGGCKVKPPVNDALPHMETPWYRALHEGVFVFYHMAFTLGLRPSRARRTQHPADGPALLILANHQSFLDPMMIGVAARRPLVYLARKTLFRNRHFARVISIMNSVPIDQEGVGKEGIRAILGQLQLGRPVVVFPEGSRTADGAIHPLKPGIHLIIKRLPVPIIPVGIAGAYGAGRFGDTIRFRRPCFCPPGPDVPPCRSANRSMGTASPRCRASKPCRSCSIASSPRKHARKSSGGVELWPCASRAFNEYTAQLTPTRVHSYEQHGIVCLGPSR